MRCGFYRKSLFFDFLTEEEIQQVFPLIDYQQIKKNTIVQTPESSEEKLYFIKDGAVRIYDITENGKVFTISILGPYSIFGYMRPLSFGTEGIYIATITDTMLCSISEDNYEQLQLAYPQITLKTMEILSARLHEKQQLLKMMATANVREQIKHLLVSMADTYGCKGPAYVKIPFPLSHQEIANMLGITREAASINIHKLKKDGFIRNPQRKIIEVQAALCDSDYRKIK
ncbi:Crp/Fnr family transcriptional regulator [Siminovitchia acidinfaciens]